MLGAQGRYRFCEKSLEFAITRCAIVAKWDECPLQAESCQISAQCDLIEGRSLIFLARLSPNPEQLSPASQALQEFFHQFGNREPDLGRVRQAPAIGVAPPPD